MPALETGTYLHTKSGNHYEVIGVAMHSESHEALVIYRPLYDTKYELFARPFDMFTEKIKLDGVMRPRFERLSNE
ncbi:MAG TPA: DUF1653 domain-containing protein [Candidatus Saccharibacteria bacterium]|nr:DUF1653 domain-containing protein [Candidatus Saccharibacteria bacterium]